jgi:hypothetical protein
MSGLENAPGFRRVGDGQAAEDEGDPAPFASDRRWAGEVGDASLRTDYGRELAPLDLATRDAGASPSMNRFAAAE